MSRNYRKEYDNYHSRPEQKIRRAARNAARRLFADADPDKDVHHKDNNPLNNDKNNLSLVTQYYNRREPRLRKEDVDEANYKIKNGKLHISKKDYAKKSKDYKGKRKGKPTLMALDPKTGISISFEVVFEEDIGTITGPHIAGTGDDSSTVIVKKKKKVYRREALKKKIINNVLALNKKVK